MMRLHRYLLLPSRHQLHFLVLVFETLIAFAALAEVVTAQTSDAKERFFREYPSDVKRLQDFYTHIEITEAQTGQYIRDAGPQGKKYTYRSNGALIRVDLLAEDGKTRSAAVNSPTLRFGVKQNESHDGFFLAEANPDSYEAYTRRARVGGVKLPFAAYCIFGDRILDLLQDKSRCTVNEVINVDQDGKKAVRVSFVEHVNAKSEPAGWFLFSPEDSYALLEAHYPTFRIVNTYSHKVQFVPVIQTAEFWYTGAGKETLRWRAEAIDVKIAAAPEAEFSLASFGLPDPFVKRSSTWLWWPLLGVLCLILAGILAYLSRPKRTGTTSAM